MNRRARPPLYGLEGRRRRRRRRRLSLPPVPPLAALAVVLLAALASASAFVAYRLWPLTDRSAGYIAGPVAAAPATGGTHRPAPARRPLSAVSASHVRIRGVRVGAGLVVAAASGTVLWEHEAHTRVPVASLTKLMTALAADPGIPGLDRMFAVTPAMTGVPGYTVGLHPGDHVTARDMLAAALIASGNDAADALAVHRSGTIAGFVRLMNATARRMHLADTRFSNPSGIFDAGNHSSAWDVAELSRAVLERPLLRRLVGRRAYQGSVALYVNRNRLLWSYPGAIGVKTGSTTASGPCLVAAATRHGRTVLAVLLNVHGDEFAAGARLLRWGFHHGG